MGRAYLILAVAGMLPVPAAGQTLERRLAAIDHGTVHLDYAARPGICDDGIQNLSNRQESTEEWESDCETQPVRVALRVHDHRIVAIRTYVGGRWRTGSTASNLGTVRPQEAAAWFLHLAAESADLNGDPVLPATLADSVTIWPALLRLARNAQVPEARRRSAIFWLGQAAGAAAAHALDSIAVDDSGDREVRKQAVFALSQRSVNEGVPALIRIARSNRDPELRKTALFWLGQSQDPRALQLFEEILR
jgi:hypothetical protein